MGSVVFYKFRSAKDFDQAVFDGTGISVFDLKHDIIVNKKLGKGTDFDLAIYNAHTNEEYADDSFIIPRNTSILVNRNPASRPGRGTAQRYLTNAGPVVSSSDRPTSAAPGGNVLPKTMTLVNNQSFRPGGAQRPNGTSTEAMSEEQRIQAMFSSQETQWQEDQERMATHRPVMRQWTGGFRGRGGAAPGGPSRDGSGSTVRPPAAGAPAANTSDSSSSGASSEPQSGMGGTSGWYGGMPQRPPPPGYICYRCGQKGHYINVCPTIGDEKFDRPKLKRTTGIPRIFLKKVDRDDKSVVDGGVMVTQNGDLVVAAPNSEAWSKLAPTAAQNALIGDLYELAPVLPEFECPHCHKNMKDAIVMACCKAHYCEECIRNRLLDHEDHSKRFKCPSCDSPSFPDELKPDKELRAAVEAHIRAFANGRSGDGATPSRSRSPSENPAAADDGAASGVDSKPYKVVDPALVAAATIAIGGPISSSSSSTAIPVYSSESDVGNSGNSNGMVRGRGRGGQNYYNMGGRGGFASMQHGMGGMRGMGYAGFNYRGGYGYQGAPFASMQGVNWNPMYDGAGMGHMMNGGMIHEQQQYGWRDDLKRKRDNSDVIDVGGGDGLGSTSKEARVD